MSDPMLLPCPFCGDPMKHWGHEEVIHANGDACIIGKNGFFAAAWNRRIPASDGRAEGLREAAQIAYRICAETRHVTLGQKCADTILARSAEIEEKADE